MPGFSLWFLVGNGGMDPHDSPFRLTKNQSVVCYIPDPSYYRLATRCHYDGCVGPVLVLFMARMLLLPAAVVLLF